MDCLFCAIDTGDAEASLVARTDGALAFLDLFPFNEGHTLVIPHTHSVGLRDLGDDDAAEVMRLGRQVADALWELGMADGVNLFLADGQIAGQTVFHTHLHVVPRREGDGFPAGFESSPQADRTHLDVIAARMRTAFA